VTDTLRGQNRAICPYGVDSDETTSCIEVVFLLKRKNTSRYLT
jgi:hypothetical protein